MINIIMKNKLLTNGVCIMKKLFILSMLFLSACAGPQGDTGSQGPAASVPTTPTTPEQDAISAIVASENTYREGLGETQLSAGLSCSVQLVGSGQWLASNSPGYVASQGVVTALAGSTAYSYLLQTSFDQPNSSSGVNNLIPVPIQAIFVNQNYKINCSGQIVVTDTAYYNFDVNSDDGSILTIDGSQVINNDGNHGMTDKVGTKYLRNGVHTFNLVYSQSDSGSFGLILQANGSLVDPMYFFH